MIQPKYKAQVDLLLSILPHVAKEESLALTGGTAINLFVRDMPRLSVDFQIGYSTNWVHIRNGLCATFKVRQRSPCSTTGLLLTSNHHLLTYLLYMCS